MSEWKTVNINQNIRFKLRPSGERIWHEYWKPYCEGRDTLPPADADGWREDQLWQVMAILGQHFHNGFDSPLETEIQIES